MPSFGLLDSEASSQTSSTGTFRILWETESISTPRRSSKKKSYIIAKNEAECAQFSSFPRSQVISHEDEENSYKDFWNSAISKSQKFAQRNTSVLEVKKDAWIQALEQLHLSDAPQDATCGLTESFERQHRELEGRIKALRKTRTLLEAKDSQKPQAPDPQKSQPQTLQQPQSSQQSQISQQPQSSQQSQSQDAQQQLSMREDGSRTTAIKRFEEISAVARPLLDSWRRVSENRSDPVKEACRKLRMTINRSVGQISNSRSQVVNVVQGLQSLYGDAWKRGGADLLNYCIVTTANKIVEQAETQVSLHSPSAFPIAQVVVDLSISQKGLVLVLVYLMMERCPYAVPRYIPRQPGQSEQSHKLAMGYLISDKVIEGEQPYTERMAGILCLYGAIVQAKPYLGGSSPYDISNAWLWMASVLNIHPQPITPYLICSFLESAGFELYRKYPAFQKVLKFISEQYLKMIPSGSVAAKTRLELYVGDFFKTNPPSIAIPEGSVLLQMSAIKRALLYILFYLTAMAFAQDVTMDFELFPSERAEGITAVRFSDELTTQQPIVVFKSLSGCSPIVVKSAIIRRAEGGSVIGLYCRADDSEPALSISFVIDIHSPVQLDSLTANYVKDNVHVVVGSELCKDMRFEKVEISKPFPQFLIL